MIGLLRTLLSPSARALRGELGLLEQELEDERKRSAELTLKLGEPAATDADWQRWCNALFIVHEHTFDQAKAWLDVDDAGVTSEGRIFVRRGDDSSYADYEPCIEMTEQLRDLADELNEQLPDFLADDDVPGDGQPAGDAPARTHWQPARCECSKRWKHVERCELRYEIELLEAVEALGGKPAELAKLYRHAVDSWWVGLASRAQLEGDIRDQIKATIAERDQARRELEGARRELGRLKRERIDAGEPLTFTPLARELDAARYWLELDAVRVSGDHNSLFPTGDLVVRLGPNGMRAPYDPSWSTQELRDKIRELDSKLTLSVQPDQPTASPAPVPEPTARPATALSVPVIQLLNELLDDEFASAVTWLGLAELFLATTGDLVARTDEGLEQRAVFDPARPVRDQLADLDARLKLAEHAAEGHVPAGDPLFPDDDADPDLQAQSSLDGIAADATATTTETPAPTPEVAP